MVNTLISNLISLILTSYVYEDTIYMYKIYHFNVIVGLFLEQIRTAHIAIPERTLDIVIRLFDCF